MMQKRLILWCRALWSAAFLCMASAAGAQTFTVNFSHWKGPPLIKTLLGVYQTPFLTERQLLKSTAWLPQIGVQNMRYEIAWGKPGALHDHQISGTATEPHLNFHPLNQLVKRLESVQVQPLLALTYCPDPLKTRTVWSAWQDMPDSLPSWSRIVASYVRHFRHHGQLADPLYEVWNEPDTPVPGGKMFFTGGPEEYGRLYAATAAAVHAGDPDAGVGGPAIAYNLQYLTPILSQPMDFASIHAYDNLPSQVAAMQQALASRPSVPIFVTEYSSYNTFGPKAPVSRYPAAERFFQDMDQMLNDPDLVHVYWAQWVDDNLGLITNNGHKKALYNAFKLYAMMPTDRVQVTPDNPAGIRAMASSDAHVAAAVLWNTHKTQQNATLYCAHLPFKSGTMQVFRIDRRHASYIDDPASENLLPVETEHVSQSACWSGPLPGHSVVFFHFFQKHSRPSVVSLPGVYIRSHYWFIDRSSPAYADFNPHTFMARLGMGNKNKGLAEIGVVIANPANCISIQLKRSGPLKQQDKDSLLAIRLDFPFPSGGYQRSVMLHGRLFSPVRQVSLPWGEGKASCSLFKAGIDREHPFKVYLNSLAPDHWNRKRLLITFILQDAGAGSHIRISLTRAKTPSL